MKDKASEQASLCVSSTKLPQFSQSSPTITLAMDNNSGFRQANRPIIDRMRDSNVVQAQM